ncbi:MAG: prolyl oligopeptidase family serine peptidase [Candidatus Binataceae bacterium]|jgi:dienelactone hydrolase
MHLFSNRNGLLRAAVMLLAAALLAGCQAANAKLVIGGARVEQFSFDVAAGQNHFHIEGLLARNVNATGPLPALLVLNPNGGNARRCIQSAGHLTELGIHVACISLPGYGASSGPSRFLGPQSVAAARRALDLLQARTDVDSSRLGLWGVSTGALVAGLVMDSDPRLRAVVLQSGAYDMTTFWPHAPLLTKLEILHEVWPSRRVLKERSVMAHLPNRLDCSVLILHGQNDKRIPVRQAEALEQALRERGARVETIVFPNGRDSLGHQVEQPLEAFLRANLIAAN